jgi:hypothetical protein
MFLWQVRNQAIEVKSMHACMPVVVKRKLLQISKMILKVFKKSWGKLFNNYLAERHSDEDDTKNLKKVSAKSAAR